MRGRRVIALSLVLLWATHAAAQFPERTVRLLVGFGAGGGTDVSARLIAKSLTETWGRSVVVENRPGADAAIAKGDLQTLQKTLAVGLEQGLAEEWHWISRMQDHG